MRAVRISNIGIHCVAISTACGLASFFRLPFVIAENGGGSFVLLYFAVAIFLGLPLMIAEFILGQARRSSLNRALQILQPRKQIAWLKILGRVSVAVCAIVLAYYSVLSGWLLYYTEQFLLSSLGGARHAVASIPPFSAVSNQGFLQLGLASVHLILASLVVERGLLGFEKGMKILVPLFLGLLIILIYFTLSRLEVADALRFLFYPDFSKLRASSLLSAIGQVCLTFTLGFGIITTFGSYLPERASISKLSLQITIYGVIFSLCCPLVVYPVALSVTDKSLADVGLVFEVLPQFFQNLAGGSSFGLLFFICLYLASLVSSICLMEVLVVSIADCFPIKRKTAVSGVILMTLAFALGPCFSSSGFQALRFGRHGLFEILDFTLFNVLVPLLVFGLCRAISKGLRTNEQRSHFSSSDTAEAQSLFPTWQALLRYVAPGIVVGGFVLLFLGFLS